MARVLVGVPFLLLLLGVCSAQTNITANGTKTNNTMTSPGTTTGTSGSTTTSGTSTSGVAINGPTTGVPGNNSIYDCKSTEPPLVNLGCVVLYSLSQGAGRRLSRGRGQVVDGHL